MRHHESGPENSAPKYRDLPSRTGRAEKLAWGVFGANDQLGTLNFLTPERVVAAKSSIVDGAVFNLNLPLQEFDPPLISHRGLVKHEVFGLNEFHRDDRIDSLFPQSSTQIDSLRHFAHPDFGFYNGFPAEEIVTGTPTLGIQCMAERGIAGRGVLLDVVAYRESIGRGIDHGASEKITVQDLEETAQFQKTELKPGDILLLRFGWIKNFRGLDASQRNTNSAGLEATESIAEWIWDHQFSMVAADNIALEAWPADPHMIPTDAERSGELQTSSHTGMLHRLLIPLLGLAIGELWDLEALAVAAHQRNKFDVFVTAEPLNLVGGVGSTANALAII